MDRQVSDLEKGRELTGVLMISCQISNAHETNY